MAEFPTLGKHCKAALCHRLDFLPFICDYCKESFCSDHKEPSQHACSFAAIYQGTLGGPSTSDQTPHTPSSPPKPKSTPCQANNCSTTMFLPMVCEKCKLNYCISHRFPSDHACPSLAAAQPISPKPSAYTPKEVPVRSFGHKSDKTSRQVQLMMLKMKAKGDTAIPQDDRLYFSVNVPSQMTQEGYFISKNWVVGRSVDYLAREFNVTNTNNIPGARQLTIKLVDGFPLSLNDAWYDVIASTIVASGDTIVLDYLA